MKKKRFKLGAILLLGLSLTSVHAQESLNTSGYNASGNGGSVSYSVGQLVYSTNTGASGSVGQGVHQSYVISVVSGINEAKGINLSVLAYPNPTTDFLQLDVEAKAMLSTPSMMYQLFDMKGKLLLSKQMIGSATQIDMSSLLPAQYILRVTSNNQSIKEFKIIKK